MWVGHTKGADSVEPKLRVQPESQTKTRSRTAFEFFANELATESGLESHRRSSD